MTRATNGNPATPPTAGFTLIEGLLHEYRDTGRVPTLENWTTGAVQRLAQFRAANPSPQAQREATQVEQALNLAVELIAEMAKTAQNPPRR
jgi:hypothetical protein